MFVETKIFGISMVARRSRRGLVVGSYAVLTALMIVRGVFYGVERYWSSIDGMWALYLVWFGVSVGVFGRIVRQQTFPQGPVDMGDGVPRSLNELAKGPRGQDDELDERGIGIRNRAYFWSFRVLAFGVVMAWAVEFWLRDSKVVGAVGARFAVQSMLFVLVALACTLPQAVILWNEPDVVED